MNFIVDVDAQSRLKEGKEMVEKRGERREEEIGLVPKQQEWVTPEQYRLG